MGGIACFLLGIGFELASIALKRRAMARLGARWVHVVLMLSPFAYGIPLLIGFLISRQALVGAAVGIVLCKAVYLVCLMRAIRKGGDDKDGHRDNSTER